MKNEDLHIAVMIGSIRKERQSDKPANVLAEYLKGLGVHVKVLDLQKLDLPMFDDGIEHDGRTELLEAYQRMDGIIIVTPEYNHSIPSPVKNAIDYARDKELMGKPMASVGTSRGHWGGARVLPELRHIWTGAGGISLPVSLQTPMVTEFDESNPPEKWIEGMEGFVQNTLKWFMIIKSGKETIE